MTKPKIVDVVLGTNPTTSPKKETKNITIPKINYSFVCEMFEEECMNKLDKTNIDELMYTLKAIDANYAFMCINTDDEDNDHMYNYSSFYNQFSTIHQLTMNTKKIDLNYIKKSPDKEKFNFYINMCTSCFNIFTVQELVDFLISVTFTTISEHDESGLPILLDKEQLAHITNLVSYIFEINRWVTTYA